MSAPLTFAWRNIVFGRDVDDAWALFRVETESYAGLPLAGKLELLGRHAGFAAGIEADFQVLRVSRGWSPDAYASAAAAALDGEHGRAEDLGRLLDQHRAALGTGEIARPEVFLAVALRGSQSAHSPLQRTWSAVRRSLGLSDARGVTRRRLDELELAERGAFHRVADYFDADRATTRELQWLIRRAATRGAGEPWLDEFWRPQAMVIEAPDEDGGVRFEPLEADVMRLLDAPLTLQRDHLQVGNAFQTVLVMGALPETVTFPGHHAELMFAPLESVPFPVDACFAAQWIPNDAAVALTRRRIVDADHAFTEESQGEHGPMADTSARPDLARALEEELTGTDRPPLLRSQLTYAIGAPSRDELDARVRLLRRELAPISLYRPKDIQLPLWVSQLPGQRARIRRYDDLLLPEQFGGMVPVATHAVGSRAGLLIGRTLTGSRQPVLFDITEGSRTSRPPALLCTGSLGSGKTLTAQLLAFHAFVGGSQVVDLDPKGDHHLAAVVGAENVEHIELSARADDRGMLDPLRIAPPDLRVELAHSFLTELLPSPVPPEWQTEVRAAVTAVAERGGRSCGLVLDELDERGQDAQAAARAIDVHASSGLLQLGFAHRGEQDEPETQRPLVSLRIANLTLPSPGTPKPDLTHEERTGRALLRLLAVQSLHLAGSDWSRHKVLIVEELSQLIGDALGLSLIQRIVRLCRSQNATPILVTQVVEDVDAISDLVGCFMAFGVETDREAARVLELLGLDADDRALRAQLRGFRRGRCLMRDYEGRVAPVQIELLDPGLLRALDTTPRVRSSAGAGDAATMA